MYIIRIMLLGLALAFVNCATPTSDPALRSIEELAPAFDIIRILPPDEDISPELRAFSGSWAGRWDGILPSQLIVEEISADSAKIIYTWGDHPSGYFKKGRIRRTAKAFPFGKIELAGETSLIFEIDIEEDVLYGTRESPTSISRIVMERKTP